MRAHAVQIVGRWTVMMRSMVQGWPIECLGVSVRMQLDLVMTKLQWLFRYFKGGCLCDVIVKNAYHLTWVGVYY